LGIHEEQDQSVDTISPVDHVDVEREGPEQRIYKDIRGTHKLLMQQFNKEDSDEAQFTHLQVQLCKRSRSALDFILWDITGGEFDNLPQLRPGQQLSKKECALRIIEWVSLCLNMTLLPQTLSPAKNKATSI
jgi:hypothetical protein